MFFDEAAEVEVRRLWRLLADAGLPSLATSTHRRHRPHVSLFAAESIAEVDLERLRLLVAGRRPTLPLYLMGTFPGHEGALFLRVPVTTDLLDLQAEVYRTVAERSIGPYPAFLPGTWVPHCTLATGLDGTGMAEAFELLGGYRPVVATVSAMGIVDTRTGEITPLTPASLVG